MDRAEEHAIDEIDKAIGEIKRAAIMDGKDVRDHMPVDVHLVRHDRFRKAMELLDERWTLLIVRELLRGSKHFNDLRRGVPKMSPALLSKRLKSLTRAGVVERTDIDGRTSYSLTPCGQELAPVVDALGAWGVRWIPEFGDEDLDAIAKQANDTIYGLAASVWTRNGGTAHKLASRIRSGTVWINCHNVFDASLPFGGYKQSGWGREMGEEVFHSYTEIKAVTAAL